MRTRLGLAALLALLVGGRVPAGAATITVVNNDGAGEGFNDTTAVAAVGGNPGTTLGAQRLNAFTHAANLWGAQLTSSVTIRVAATMNHLTCSASSATLGSAGANTVHLDFTNAPYSNTWYPQALANKIAGADLTGVDDIVAQFNSAIGTTCPFPKSWYYGLDGNPAGDELDFVTVVLHEIGHGLGFQTYVTTSTGARFNDRDDAFMKLLEDHSLGLTWPSMTDAQRAASAIDDTDLHWTGSAAVAAGSILSAGRHADGHIQMYAPPTLVGGSSVSHWDTALTPNELMEPSYTVDMTDPSLARDLMTDLGWDLTTTTSTSTSSTTSTSSSTTSTSSSTSTSTSQPTTTSTSSSTSTTSSSTSSSTTSTSSSTSTSTNSTSSSTTTTSTSTSSSTSVAPPPSTTSSTVATTPSTTSSTTSSTSTSSTSSTSTSQTTSTSTATTTSGAPPTSSTTTLSITTSTATSSTTTLPVTTSTSSSTTTTTLPGQQPALCPPTPLVSCRRAASQRSAVVLRNAAADPKDLLKWKIARGGRAAPGDFGDPVAGGATFGLCLYDASAAAQPLYTGTIALGGSCNGKSCWKGLAEGGYRYKNKAGVPGGFTNVKLRPNASDELGLVVKGKGAALAMPRLGLVSPVRMQLVLSDGVGTVCWESSFTTAVKNGPSIFRANGS